MLADALLPHALPLLASPEDLRTDSELDEPFEMRAPLGWVGHIERRVAALARE